MDENQIKVPLAEAVYKHGVRKTIRESGVDHKTLSTAMKGHRMPKLETAQKIARALGLGIDQIEWPMGYGERLQILDAPDSDNSVAPEPVGIYEDSRLRADIEALVERTVQRRMAEFVAQQGLGGQVAAQSMGGDDEVVTQT